MLGTHDILQFKISLDVPDNPSERKRSLVIFIQKSVILSLIISFKKRCSHPNYMYSDHKMRKAERARQPREGMRLLWFVIWRADAWIDWRGVWRAKAKPRVRGDAI